MKKWGFRKRTFVFLLSIIIIITGGCKSKMTVNSDSEKLEIIQKEKWTEVGKDIFVFSSAYYRTNMTLIVSEKEALLIDTGMYDTECQNVMEFIKERDIKIKTIIITHDHDDHVANLEKFKTEDVVVITPDNAKENQFVSIGDKNLKIMFTEGHYKPNSHISIEIENQSILIAGDIIDNDYVASAVAPGGDIRKLIETLNMFQEKNYQIVIPGHGDVGGSELIVKHLEYFNNKIK